jgi:hypothetical protein
MGLALYKSAINIGDVLVSEKHRPLEHLFRSFLMIKGKGYRYNVRHGYIDLCGDHQLWCVAACSISDEPLSSLTCMRVLRKCEIITGHGPPH